MELKKRIFKQITQLPAAQPTTERYYDKSQTKRMLWSTNRDHLHWLSVFFNKRVLCASAAMA